MMSGEPKHNSGMCIEKTATASLESRDASFALRKRLRLSTPRWFCDSETGKASCSAVSLFEISH
jgi:hypothetical protein